MACCVHFQVGTQAQIVSSQPTVPTLSQHLREDNFLKIISRRCFISGTNVATCKEAAVQDILVRVFEAGRTTPGYGVVLHPKAPNKK